MCAHLRKSLLYGALILLSFAFATSAKADTISDGGVTFTGTVTGNTVTLQIACDGTVLGCSGWYVGDLSLKGFTFTGSPTTGSPITLSGYSVMNGGQNNKAVGSGGGCNSTQPDQAVCWDAPTTLDQMGTITDIFTADIANGAVSGPLHVQATFYNNPAGDGVYGDKVLAVSDDLIGANGSPSPVPEPASMVLLGTGLLALGGFARRRASKGQEHAV